jgi:hypothetical protein
VSGISSALLRPVKKDSVQKGAFNEVTKAREGKEEAASSTRRNLPYPRLIIAHGVIISKRQTPSASWLAGPWLIRNTLTGKRGEQGVSMENKSCQGGTSIIIVLMSWIFFSYFLNQWKGASQGDQSLITRS